jgi:hypothetical protein
MKDDDKTEKLGPGELEYLQANHAEMFGEPVPEPTPEILIMVPEAARRLGWSPSTLYAEIQAGRWTAGVVRRGPAGGSILISWTAVTAYLARVGLGDP